MRIIGLATISLLFPLLLKANDITLNCSGKSIRYSDRINALEDIQSFRIDAETKKVQYGQVEMLFAEKGNTIFWLEDSESEWGVWRFDHRLDRVSGEYTQTVLRRSSGEVEFKFTHESTYRCVKKEQLF